MDLKSKYIDLLLDMHKYNSDRAAAHLEYRDRFAQIIIYLYAALFTLMFAVGLRIVAVPFAILLIVVSKFSELLILKFYERSEFHFSRARNLRLQIDEEFGGEFRSIGDIFGVALQEHREKFKIEGRRGWEAKIVNLHVHALSATLHKIFFIMGVCFLLAIVGNFLSCRYSQICIGNDQLGKGVLSK